jgi:hypothetical protein
MIPSAKDVRTGFPEQYFNGDKKLGNGSAAVGVDWSVPILSTDRKRVLRRPLPPISMLSLLQKK